MLFTLILLTDISHTDLIFILLDRPDERHDRLISEHIMHAHGPTGGAPSSKRPRTSYESGERASTLTGDSLDLTAEATLAQRLRHQINTCVQQFGASSSGGRLCGVLSVELMRRYIEYAKRYVEPTLSPGAAKVLQRLYLTMRAQASSGQSIPVTTRHLESLIRLAQARARVDLREEVPRVVIIAHRRFCFRSFVPSVHCGLVGFVVCR